MGALRQYYDTDFSYACRMHVKLHYEGESIDGTVLYDIAAHAAFLTCYLPGASRTFEGFVGFIKALRYGEPVSLDGRITLPSTKEQPGTKLRIVNKEHMEVEYQLLGDPVWKSTRAISATKRLFLYSETNLLPEQIAELQTIAGKMGHELQFRADDYVNGRTMLEKPLAFISHDSRDKNTVARPIAVSLQRMLCPVWYDEFSLKVGDHLRESIERGLRECRKCVLVLSPNFFANTGWTKREFDSIFTREVLEASHVVLPVWCGVTKDQVYQYSPSLLNVKGLDWHNLGEEEVCRQLSRAILP